MNQPQINPAADALGVTALTVKIDKLTLLVERLSERPGPTHYTVKQAAEIKGLCTKTIYRMISDGELERTSDGIPATQF
jgi:hypothetical protein